LEIGTGTGYNAALLAGHVGDHQVTTIEVDPVLAAQARADLAAAGYQPTVICGDGTAGHPPPRRSTPGSGSSRDGSARWLDRGERVHLWLGLPRFPIHPAVRAHHLRLNA
jgi:hypothetical protein